MKNVVVMFRHLPTSDDNAERYTPASSSITPELLTDDTIKRLKGVALEVTRRLNITRVYHADNERSRITAEVLFGDWKIEKTSTPSLRNVHCPDWYGLTESEAEKCDPALYKLWHDQPEKVKFPHGESLRDVVARVKALLASIDDNVFLIGHTCPIQTLLCIKLGLPPGSIWRFKPEHFGFSAASDGILWAFNSSDLTPITFRF